MYKAIYLYICLKANKQTRTEFVGLFVCVYGYTFRSALTHRAEILIGWQGMDPRSLT